MFSSSVYAKVRLRFKVQMGFFQNLPKIWEAKIWKSKKLREGLIASPEVFEKF